MERQLSDRLCACGCGQRTFLAVETHSAYGHVKGQPLKYRLGHSEKKRSRGDGPNPGGLCLCGCGERTPIAKASDHRTGNIAGQPTRFCLGHSSANPVLRGDGPNPDGLCMCGCGGRAPIATRSKARLGHIKGKPIQFIQGHQRRAGEPTIDESGCWVWPGRERGDTTSDGRRYIAYRLYYERAKGPIPVGHVLHHECENPRCVNPDHLRPMTQAEHVRLHKKAV